MKLNNETKVGLLVLVSLAVLVGLTIKAGNFNLKKDGCRIKAVFTDIDGIKLNSPVMFNGLEVGLVEDVNIEEDSDQTHMVLTLWVSHQARLHEGTKALIKNLGFMGEKYVALIGVDSRTPLLHEGAIIQGQSPADFNQILTSSQELLGHLNGIATNVQERLQKNDKNIDDILTNFNATSKNLEITTANLDEMSADLKHHPWKLLFKGRDK
jgi:phospholipid/cholesterol/gamma-HCH transport system substrate-binding protein